MNCKYILHYAIIGCIIWAFKTPETTAIPAGTKPDSNEEFGDRIVGGKLAIPHSYPFAARIHFHDKEEYTKCGGSLIDNDIVMTAAHCFYRHMHWKFFKQLHPDYFSVYLGDNDFSVVGEEGEVHRKVKRYIRHKWYSPANRINDIALIMLDKPVNFTEFIQPIELATEEVDVGSQCTVIGWGITDPNDTRSASDKLKELTMPIVSSEKCKSMSNFTKEDLSDDMICAQHLQTGQDSCASDSGGPLFCKNEDDKLIQVGITSWGPQTCGDGSFPGVYTKVSKFGAWIKKSIKRMRAVDKPTRR